MTRPRLGHFFPGRDEELFPAQLTVVPMWKYSNFIALPPFLVLAPSLFTSCQVQREVEAPPPPKLDESANIEQEQPLASAEGVATNVSGTEAQKTNAQQVEPGDWWKIPYPKTFDSTLLTQTLPFISVRGKDFVDESGKVIVFSGVNISDPDKLSREGRWSRSHFEVIKSWGAQVVRVPVHPSAWEGRGHDEYFQLLDDAVIWANSLGLYLIIDWHSIGNLKSGLFQHPMYDTSLQETLSFWRKIAHRYQGISTIAFYELFNEPTVYNQNLGTISFAEWKAMNEEMIDIIYSFDRKVIPLVAGFNWAYDLTPFEKTPIEREGVAYVSHPYPQKTGEPFSKNWDKAFGFMAKRAPLFATEIGYMPANDPHAHVPAIDEGPYGPRMTNYLAERGASWVAWCFDPDWGPSLIADWNYTPTISGAHFRKVMLEASGK